MIRNRVGEAVPLLGTHKNLQCHTTSHRRRQGGKLALQSSIALEEASIDEVFSDVATVNTAVRAAQ